MGQPLSVAPPVDIYVYSNFSEIVRIAANTGTLTHLPVSPPDDYLVQRLAVDAEGNLYFATYERGTGILEMPAGGGPLRTYATTIFAVSVAADWAGNAYAIGQDLVSGEQQAVKIPSDGSPPIVLWSGSESLAAVAVDGLMNVYITIAGPKILVLSARGGHRVVDIASAVSGDYSVTSFFAVDPQGRNIFIAEDGESHVLGGGNPETDGVMVKIPLDGAPPTRTRIDRYYEAFQDFGGVTVDDWGNAYLADYFAGRVIMVPADGGPQVSIAELPSVWGIAVKPTRRERFAPPDLIGRLFGGAASDGGGWLVIGGRFIPIPPRSPVLEALVRRAAPYLGGAVHNAELFARLQAMRSTGKSEEGPATR